MTATPTVQKVLEIDGPYFDERELLLAAYADGLSVTDCRSLVAELDDERNEEFAAQQASEINAESAWLRAAESVGFDEAEADRDELLAAIAKAKYGAARVGNPSVVALYKTAYKIAEKIDS